MSGDSGSGPPTTAEIDRMDGPALNRYLTNVLLSAQTEAPGALQGEYLWAHVREVAARMITRYRDILRFRRDMRELSGRRRELESLAEYCELYEHGPFPSVPLGDPGHLAAALIIYKAPDQVDAIPSKYR